MEAVPGLLSGRRAEPQRCPLDRRAGGCHGPWDHNATRIGRQKTAHRQRSKTRTWPHQIFAWMLGRRWDQRNCRPAAQNRSLPLPGIGRTGMPQRQNPGWINTLDCRRRARPGGWPLHPFPLLPLNWALRRAEPGCYDKTTDWPERRTDSVSEPSLISHFLSTKLRAPVLCIGSLAASSRACSKDPAR